MGEYFVYRMGRKYVWVRLMIATHGHYARGESMILPAKSAIRPRWPMQRERLGDDKMSVFLIGKRS